MDTSSLLEDVEIKIQNFIYYFLRRVEDQFQFYLSYLEGEAPSKSISLTANIAAGVARSIPLPVVGTAASFGITQGDVMRARKADKDTAVALSDIIYYHSCKKEEVRKVLIEGAYELFCCYEMQFMQLTCNGGSTRALQKLGCDAADRYIKHLAKNKTTIINRELVIKSITDYNSNILKDLGITKEGHHVKNKDNTTWNIHKLYMKAGIYIKENNSYYKNKNNNTKLYGHRLKFMHEIPEFIEENYEKDTELCSNYSYITSFNNFEDHYKNILEFIFLKDPLDYGKFDREIKQHELLDDIQKNHVAAEVDRQNKFEVTKEYLESIKSDVALTKAEVEKINEVVVQQNEILVAKSEEPPIHLGKVLREELKNIDPTRNPKLKKLKRKLENYDFNSRIKII